MSEGLGSSGPGAGMFNRLFDAGLDIGSQFAANALKKPTPISAPVAPAPPQQVGPVMGGLQLNQTTVLVGLAAVALVVVVVLAKA